MRRALRFYRAAAWRAEALGMRYDQACAYLAIANCATASADEARAAARRARRLLAESGAVESSAWPLRPVGGASLMLADTGDERSRA